MAFLSENSGASLACGSELWACLQGIASPAKTISAFGDNQGQPWHAGIPQWAGLLGLSLAQITSSTPVFQAQQTGPSNYTLPDELKPQKPFTFGGETKFPFFWAPFQLAEDKSPCNKILRTANSAPGCRKAGASCAQRQRQQDTPQRRRRHRANERRVFFLSSHLFWGSAGFNLPRNDLLVRKGKEKWKERKSHHPTYGFSFNPLPVHSLIP